MASTFEFFQKKLNIKSGNTATTSLQQLNIDSELSQLQITSKKYFTIAKEAAAADGNQLAISQKVAFELSNNEHKEFLKNCTGIFKTHAATLHAIDCKMVLSVVVGVIASALAFLPFFGALSMIGWGCALYCMQDRTNAYTQYNESLRLLVGVCNWSLGTKPSDNTAATLLTENDEVRTMMSALYPVLTEPQVKHLIADEIETKFVGEFTKYNAIDPNISANDLILSKHGSEFRRCIYGLNKGELVDMLDAICSTLPDLYNAIAQGIKSLQHKFKTLSVVSENIDHNTVPAM